MPKYKKKGVGERQYSDSLTSTLKVGEGSAGFGLCARLWRKPTEPLTVLYVDVKVVQKSSLKKPLPVYLEQRNKAVEILETQERSQWKKDIGYHERSLNETVMFRYKTAFGGRLQARKWEN